MALKAKMSEIFADYSLTNKNGVLQNVRIFSQYMPLPNGISLANKASGIKNYDETDYEANFPCVIIHYDDCVDDEERRLELSTHKVKLIFGAYDEDKECQAYIDIMQMMDIVKLELLTRRILAGKFRLNMPVKSQLLELDTWPIYFGQLDLIYESGRATMPADFVYGNGRFCKGN